MFAKILIIAATSIAAVRACTNAGQFPTKPVSAPSADSWPTIGQPYTIQWDDTYQDSTITMSLYTGCPNNCKELTDIAGGIKNTGSYTWTPSSTLQANDGYGILFINENPCLTSWVYFGLHPAGYSGSTNPSSNTPAVSSGTTIASSGTTSPSSAPSASTVTVVPHHSTVTVTVMETQYAAAPVVSKSFSSSSSCVQSTITMKVLNSTTTAVSQSSITQTLLSTTSKTSTAPTATASLFKSDGVSVKPAQALCISALGGVVAIFAAFVL